MMAHRQFDQEENRLDYSQLLCPEPNYSLDFAVGMTYSIDMEALLGVPVALGMFSDLESVAAQNPFFLLEAIRKSSDDIAIFCNIDGIKLPQNIRPVYSLLENSLFPIDLGGKANFHPKLWVISYRSEFDERMIKVIALSRNLTFDRSMDVAVELVGPVGDGVNEYHQPLADMLRFVADYAPAKKKKAIKTLANDVLRVKEFTCDLPFEDYRFLPFGIPKYRKYASSVFEDAKELIVMSPFLSSSVVKQLMAGRRQTVLITRKNSVTPEIYRLAQEVYVPKDAILDNELLEDADQSEAAKRDLHAKVYFKSCYNGNFLYLGSLNASANAFYNNVEFMVELKYKPYHASFSSVLNDMIPERNCLFEPLMCEPDEAEPENEETTSSMSDAIRAVQRAVVTQQGDKFTIGVACGQLAEPAEIAPLFRRKLFMPMAGSVRFEGLLLRELSEFYILRRGEEHCIVKVPTDGIPLEDRDKAIYNAVIGDRTGFMAYVSFLLADSYAEAGLEQQALMDLMNEGSESGRREMPTAVYERLLRTAAWYPDRLDAVEDMMAKVSPELVDESFSKLIRTFRAAAGKRRKRK